MIGIATPSEPMNAFAYRDLAARAIDDIVARAKSPVCMRCTGLLMLTKPMRFCGTKRSRAAGAASGAIADQPEAEKSCTKFLRNLTRIVQSVSTQTTSGASRAPSKFSGSRRHAHRAESP